LFFIEFSLGVLLAWVWHRSCFGVCTFFLLAIYSCPVVSERCSDSLSSDVVVSGWRTTLFATDGHFT
jgi:hypothetical protein